MRTGIYLEAIKKKGEIKNKRYKSGRIYLIYDKFDMGEGEDLGNW